MARRFSEWLTDPPAPMRMDGWPAQGIAMDQRPVRFGMAVLKRRTASGELCQWVIDRDRVGDILPGLWWDNSSESSRPTGAWRDGAWPAVVTDSAAGSEKAKPALDYEYTPDGGFTARLIPDRLDGGRRPAGSRVWITSGSATIDEQVCVLEDPGQLIAQWRGPDRDTFSSYVYDLQPVTDPGWLGDDTTGKRRARMSTGWALIEEPIPREATPPPVALRRHQLAVPHTALPDAPGAPGLGWGPILAGEIAGPSLEGGRVGFLSSERSGPIVVLPEGDPHMGEALCGPCPAGPAAIHWNALIHDPAGRTGPYLFEGPYPGGGERPVIVNCHLTWHADLPHSWIDPFGGPGTPTTGRWRWVSSCQFNPAMGGEAQGPQQITARRGLAAASSPHALGAPTFVGEAPPTALSRFEGSQPGGRQPVAWVIDTIGASTSVPQSVTPRRWDYRTSQSSSRWSGGTVPGGAAFSPPEIDEITRTQADRDPVDCHLAAVAGAGLAVCDRIDRRSGKVVSGLRIRRQANGNINLVIVDASGDDDPSNPALTFISPVTFAAADIHPVRSVGGAGGSTTLMLTDHTLFVTPGGGTFTVHLPTAAGVRGIVFQVFQVGAGTVNLQPDTSAGDTVNGSDPYQMNAANASVTVKSNGNNLWGVW